MSVVKTYSVFCDSCANWVGDATSLKRTRRWAKQQGWKRVREGGRLKDLCPSCCRCGDTLTSEGLPDGLSANKKQGSS